jgi:hypothetical protein
VFMSKYIQRKRRQCQKRVCLIEELSIERRI